MLDESSAISCPFEKAILKRACACEHALKVRSPVRRAIRCGSHEAQENCIRLLRLLVEKASFALKLKHKPTALPDSEAVTIQCGGLRGLQQSLDPHAAAEKVNNVFSLVKRAIVRYKDLEALPFGEIVRDISSGKSSNEKRPTPRSSST